MRDTHRSDDAGQRDIFAQARQKTPPKRTTASRYTIRLDGDLNAELSSLCTIQNVPKSALIRELISQIIDQERERLDVDDLTTIAKPSGARLKNHDTPVQTVSGIDASD